MIYWIRRIARIIALLGFFVIFFSGLNFEDIFNGYVASIAALKAFCGGTLLWVTGFIISDIILKGAVEDIPAEVLEPLDGGIIQRLHESKKEAKIKTGGEKKPPTDNAGSKEVKK